MYVYLDEMQQGGHIKKTRIYSIYELFHIHNYTHAHTYIYCKKCSQISKKVCGFNPCTADTQLLTIQRCTHYMTRLPQGSTYIQQSIYDGWDLAEPFCQTLKNRCGKLRENGISNTSNVVTFSQDFSKRNYICMPRGNSCSRRFENRVFFHQWEGSNH